MTGGDYLEWEIRLGPATAVTVTTQAAEKIYRTADDAPARIDVRLAVDEKSRLCWLPQETILFNRFALRRSLDISLADDAELLLAESIVFGRRLMGETMEHAVLRDNWIVCRRGWRLRAWICLGDGASAWRRHCRRPWRRHADGARRARRRDAHWRRSDVACRSLPYLCCLKEGYHDTG